MRGIEEIERVQDQMLHFAGPGTGERVGAVQPVEGELPFEEFVDGIVLTGNTEGGTDEGQVEIAVPLRPVTVDFQAVAEMQGAVGEPETDFLEEVVPQALGNIQVVGAGVGRAVVAVQLDPGPNQVCICRHHPDGR